MDKPIRIIVADDHSMVRSGLRLFLIAFNDMELVGEAANGLEALRVCEQVHPDIVLMDLIMPGMDGIHAARELVTRDPRVRVIGLTSFIEPDLIREALQSGMTGLLSKDVTASELVQAIHDVRAGKPAFSPQIAALLETFPAPGPSALQGEPAGSDYGLTGREREVLALLAGGASNAEIAQKLVISVSTAKYHVSSIFNKLHVSNRAEAAARAMQQHLVEGPTPPGAPEE
jgi:NarL family two-component system response regulator LiaR